MANTERKTVSFPVYSETYDRLKLHFPDAIGREENMIKLLNSYENEVSEKEDISILLEKNQNLKKENEKLKKEIEELNDNYHSLEIKNSELKDEIEHKNSVSQSLKASLQYPTVDAPIIEDICSLLQIETISEAKEAIAILKKNNQIEEKENTILLHISPIALAMLRKTAEILSKRYNKEILPTHILVDMFIRYTIERQNEWFYPFVDKKEIIEVLATFNENIKQWDQVKQIFKLGGSTNE